MATQVAELVAKLSMDTKDFDRGVRDADKSLDKLEGTTARTGRSVDGMGGKFKGAALAMGAMAGAYAGAKVLGFAKDAIGAFSDLEESTNAVQVVFKDAAGTITDFGQTSATSVGLATSSFQQLATQTGALLKNFGYDTQAAADSTIVLTQRAADMASVFNTDVADAMNAINSALRGETEPIRRYAVDVSEATLANVALAQGIEKSVSEMDMQEKAALRLEAILAQSADTAGDFAATSDSLANKQKVLTERMEDAKAKIGKELAPAMADLLDAGLALIPVLTTVASTLGAIVNPIETGTKGFNGWAAAFGVASGNLNMMQSSAVGAGGALTGAFEEAAKVGAKVTEVDDLTQGLKDAQVGAEMLGDALELERVTMHPPRAEVLSLKDALDQARDSALSLMNTLTSGAWVRAASQRIQTNRFLGPGGAGRDEDRVDGFQSGGIVPGPMGAPRLAIVHGGEEVLTASQRAQRNVTVNMNGNVTSGGRLGDELTMALLMAGVNEQAEFHGLADIRG